MSHTVEVLLKRNLFEVFNGVDPTKRLEAIAELWSEHCTFIDPEGIHRGTREVDQVAGKFFTQFPGYTFTATGSAQSIHGVGRLAWAYGPPDDPQRITGEDVVVTENGKILALYTFVDPPKNDDSR